MFARRAVVEVEVSVLVIVAEAEDVDAATVVVVEEVVEVWSFTLLTQFWKRSPLQAIATMK